jgi:hypothetical protein
VQALSACQNSANINSIPKITSKKQALETKFQQEPTKPKGNQVRDLSGPQNKASVLRITHFSLCCTVFSDSNGLQIKCKAELCSTLVKKDPRANHFCPTHLHLKYEKKTFTSKTNEEKMTVTLNTESARPAICSAILDEKLQDLKRICKKRKRPSYNFYSNYPNQFFLRLFKEVIESGLASQSEPWLTSRNELELDPELQKL